MGDPAITERNTAGAVRHQHRVFRSCHFHIVESDILHQLRRIDALLVARSDQVMKGHPGNRDNRRSIHVRVVKAVEKANRAGACGADADAELASVFREA
jgi:hypothetical protein